MKNKTTNKQDKSHHADNYMPKSSTGGILKNYIVKKSPALSADFLYEGIIRGNITLLSQAITLVESNQKKHKAKASKIVTRCLQHKTSSVRIGITGVPGVGKSTFIEAFGMYLTELGNKVAVLAVDPSSGVRKGSILADKTRMEHLGNNPRAYIRPTAAGSSLGGVANNTRETITLCEAAGFNIILVETVGVGQSETAVHAMVDFFLLLQLPGAGDELQGIKRGITEIADAIVINKADGDLMPKAKLAKVIFNRVLHLYPPKQSDWQPKVLLCSALEKSGIGAVWKMINDFLKITKENGYFDKNRISQNKYWLKETVDEELKTAFYENPEVKKNWPVIADALSKNKITSYEAARQLMQLYEKKS